MNEITTPDPLRTSLAVVEPRPCAFMLGARWRLERHRAQEDPRREQPEPSPGDELPAPAPSATCRKDKAVWTMEITRTIGTRACRTWTSWRFTIDAVLAELVALLAGKIDLRAASTR
jgi:hypothetical protein